MPASSLKTGLWRLAALGVALVFGVMAWAMPAYQEALFKQYPNAAASLANCVACHDGPGANLLNPFGDAFLANGLVLDAALEALDSDGDGATNGEELSAAPATAPGDPNSKPGVAGTPPPPPSMPTDGATLYANNCAACHGPLASSSKVGVTLPRLQGAIAIGTGGMGYLSFLSTAQLEAIVSVLTPVTPPLSSPNHTGMWWNPAESGWGLNVNHQGDIVFATLFTYDRAGAPMWVSMAGQVQPDGKSYAGDLYQTTGPAFNTQPFGALTDANYARVGTMTLTFLSPTSGRVVFSYRGETIAKDIVPQVFGTAAAACGATTGSRAALANYQDMWWNPAESGWGVSIAHQDDTLFAALYTYDLAGNNLWLVMLAGKRQSDGSYGGDLYRVSGPAFDATPFTPITEANLVKVGTMRFVFADGANGSLAYTVDGIAVAKPITRQVFSSPVPACSSAALSSTKPSDGPALYASNCAACHGALASSTKGGASLARIQGAIAANSGGMGYLSTLSSVELDAIVGALASVAPSSPPTCGSCHAIPPGSGGHAKHDPGQSCGSCHGSGYSSTTVNTATHNNGSIDLATAAGWNAAARSCANACHGAASWSPTATLPCGSCHGIPPSSGGHVKHDPRYSCSSCHGAGYSATTVNLATHRNGTTEVTTTAGWNATSRSCANSCHGTALWSPTATLPCGSCHAIPPKSGEHGEHKSRSCSDCHGAGYSTTTVNATTHNNGVKELLTSTGWNATTRTCANACHGKEGW